MTCHDRGPSTKTCWYSFHKWFPDTNRCINIYNKCTYIFQQWTKRQRDSVELHNVDDNDASQQQVNHSYNDNDASRKPRSTIITDIVIKQFLDKIGSEHYIHFDQYNTGLQWTSMGYVCNPHLMDAEQSKSLNSLIVRMQSEPSNFRKFLNKIKAVASS